MSNKKIRLLIGLGMMFSFLFIVLTFYFIIMMGSLIGYVKSFSGFGFFLIGPLMYIFLSYHVLTRVYKFEKGKVV